MCKEKLFNTILLGIDNTFPREPDYAHENIDKKIIIFRSTMKNRLFSATVQVPDIGTSIDSDYKQHI